jgi:succinyl-CoA synthetase beta subunit
MNIHEYQAKDILRDFGAPVPKGIAVFSVEQAAEAARALGGPVWVVKSQIHAGGRGKGRFKEPAAGDRGGVRLARSVQEVVAEVEKMLGGTLVTHQTGPAGRTVRRLYVEQGSEIDRELYLSCLVDRAAGRIAFIASAAGGVNIEEVAAATPEKIVTVDVDPAAGYTPHVGRQVAYGLGLSGDQVGQCDRLLATLYRAFVEKDMSLLEVNPLVVTKAGDLLCLDAKINFDDNALFRHPEIAELRDPAEEDPKEVEAAAHDLSYVALDGTIGCMVNGAGLAMATMDIIKLYGAEPANFLDVGGGASKERVAAAFRIITADRRVKGILVNIFGGIMRCDVVAEGIVEAVRQVGLKVPLVVRLEGTNVALGKRIIAQSGLNAINADDLDDAAQKIVAAVGREAVEHPL